MVSFIIPAHNEETEIARTLQAIHDAAPILIGLKGTSNLLCRAFGRAVIFCCAP